jgi:hypothetical protein
MSEMNGPSIERPARVVRLLGVGAVVLSGVLVLVLAWAGNATFTSWNDVGRPLRAVPSLIMVALAMAGALVLGCYGARTTAGRPGAAVGTGYTALLLGVCAIMQGLMRLGAPGSGVTLALGIALIGLTLLITPGSRYALGADPGEQASGRTAPSSPPAGPVDPEVAAAGPPYPYPMPLPPAVKAAHIAALTAWQRRGLPWLQLGFLTGVFAVVWTIVSDSGRRSRGSAPILWETHPTLALGMLVGGLLLLAVTVRPVVRNSRAISRHRRLLTAYGVRLDGSNREIPPTIPTSPRAFLR